MDDAKKKNDIEKLTFEETIDRLEKIVGKIESGQTPLQAGIEQYEQGMELIKHCRGILRTAERKIEKIAEEDSKSEDNSR